MSLWLWVLFSKKIQSSVLHLDATSLILYSLFNVLKWTVDLCVLFFHQNCRFLSYSLHLSLSNQWNFSTHTSSENCFVTSIIFLCGYIQDVFQIGIYTFFFSLLFGHYRTGISFSLLQGLTLGIIAREEWTCYTFAFFPNHLLLAYIKTNFTCCYKFLDVINSIFGLSALLHGLAVCPHYLEWLYTISNFFLLLLTFSSFMYTNYSKDTCFS